MRLALSTLLLSLQFTALYAAPIQPSGFLPSAMTPASGGVIRTLPTTTPNGEPLDLATVKGWKVIYFWSAECPCVRACEAWTFLPMAKKYHGKVSFYAVAADRYDLSLSQNQLKGMVASHHLPFPVLLDPDHKVAEALSAQVTPQTFLLAPDNHVVFSGMPDDSRRYLNRTGKSGVSRTYLAAALSQALAGKPVTRPLVENQGCIIAW